ncbi:MAG: hypothetical protein ACI9MC_002627, partial [Kiritimatiellia bacterium]
MNRNVLIIAGSVVGALVLAVGGFLSVASTQPDEIHLERSIVISASAADVHAQVNDFNNFVQWSPWSPKDPNATREISDPSAGVGAKYSWSGNDQVGVGSMAITKSDANMIEQDLIFTSPMESTSTVRTVLAAEGDDIKVTWSFDMPSNLMLKAMNTVGMADMEAALGPDFEQGLQNLKIHTESAATGRMEAEKVEADRIEADRLAAEAAAMQDTDPVVEGLA